MDYQVVLNRRELQDLINLVVDECSRHYYWSINSSSDNYSYHMNVVDRLESLRDKLKRVLKFE